MMHSLTKLTIAPGARFPDESYKTNYNGSLTIVVHSLTKMKIAPGAHSLTKMKIWQVSANIACYAHTCINLEYVSSADGCFVDL